MTCEESHGGAEREEHTMSDVIDEPAVRERSFGRRAEPGDETWFEEAEPLADDEWDFADEEEPAERPARTRSRGARRPSVVFANFLMTCAVLGTLGAGAAALYGREQFTRPGPLASDSSFVVREGATLTTVATELERRGIIGDARLFGYAAKLTGRDRAIKTGEFAIPAGASMEKVLDELVDGSPVEYRVTIPEGLTVRQALARIASHPELTGDMPATEPPEGSLAAETVSFARGEKRSVVIERLRALQDERLERIWNGRSPDVPLASKEELLILGSIVEKETGLAAERPEVAAVFANRLREGWHLNTDPSVVYGVFGGDGLPSGRSITRSDLRNRNPYNTYIFRGLPPGPIAIPGEAALRAAANPAETKAMYFVADGTGGHAFAETADEHNANVRKWRKIERGEIVVERPATSTPEPSVAEPEPVANAAPAPVVVQEAPAEPAAASSPETTAAAPPAPTQAGDLLSGDELASLNAANDAAALSAPVEPPSGAANGEGTPAPGIPVPAMRPR